ncbi:MAG: ATP synthase F1 subunit delta [Actinobacteria bacterium]|nr:ATP synthase F1 subunit delta [Actinomycetota bacterium]
MSERTQAYAQAIVALANGEGALDSVEDELLQIARVVDANNDLREKLVDIHLPIGQRLAFVESQALQAAHPATKAALAMVITAGRAGDLDAIATDVSRHAAEGRDRELAEVYVAAPIDDRRREQLREALERATGKKLDLKVFVDESVVGGVRAKVGDTVIDGSLARRLNEVRTRIS